MVINNNRYKNKPAKGKAKKDERQKDTIYVDYLGLFHRGHENFQRFSYEKGWVHAFSRRADIKPITRSIVKGSFILSPEYTVEFLNSLDKI